VAILSNMFPAAPAWCAGIDQVHDEIVKIQGMLCSASFSVLPPSMVDLMSSTIFCIAPGFSIAVPMISKAAPLEYPPPSWSRLPQQPDSVGQNCAAGSKQRGGLASWTRVPQTPLCAVMSARQRRFVRRKRLAAYSLLPLLFLTVP